MDTDLGNVPSGVSGDRGVAGAISVGTMVPLPFYTDSSAG